MFNYHQTLETLDFFYNQYHSDGFIENDPIAIPHLFSKKEDIEIIGLLVALISWGNRNSIIKSGLNLVNIFEHQPYDFILNHSEKDLKYLPFFVHRTFNLSDLKVLIKFLKYIYTEHQGLEGVFSKKVLEKDLNIEKGLNYFHLLWSEFKYFQQRTDKHLASPLKKSACKRLNMFLRWMVRKDDKNIDFGIWKSIKPSQLICPLDVHVIKSAFNLKLISQNKGDWKTAVELTENLKKFDPQDPVKYDFALFMMGVEGKLF